MESHVKERKVSRINAFSMLVFSLAIGHTVSPLIQDCFIEKAYGVIIVLIILFSREVLKVIMYQVDFEGKVKWIFNFVFDLFVEGIKRFKKPS